MLGPAPAKELRDLASSFGHGLGIDVDPEMVRLARENQAADNVSFRVGSERLESVPGTFDVILDRHAPFDLTAIEAHLRPGGFFITQQVGERNMTCVKTPLGQGLGHPPIQRQALASSGMRVLAFMEYEVEYVVCDIESLVFWLNALDAMHADVHGKSALASAAMLNTVLAGNVDERGFVTNEHRYLAIAQRVRARGERGAGTLHPVPAVAHLAVVGHEDQSRYGGRIATERRGSCFSSFLSLYLSLHLMEVE